MGDAHYAGRRVVFVQYGDYGEAASRFEGGGQENYFGQRYTFDFVAGLAARGCAVTVLTFRTTYPLRRLASGVRVQGVELFPQNARARHKELTRALAALDPTDVVVAAPLPRQILWALRHGVRTLPLFADSFRGGGLKTALKNFVLRVVLSQPAIPFVSNHNVASSEDLARIGLPREKIVPFDWPALINADEHEPKEPPRAPFKLLYVGQLVHTKGVGDIVDAMPLLPDCGLSIIGAGPDEDALRARVEALGLQGRVNFLGRIPHTDVLREMRAHDVVLVPSHHAYPEGLPMTIFEALCMRTPVAVSDHPMFKRRILADRNAVVFPEKDPRALAGAVSRLLSDPAMYRAISLESAQATRAYLCPMKWHRLIELWLERSDDASREISRYSLAAWPYT